MAHSQDQHVVQYRAALGRIEHLRVTVDAQCARDALSRIFVDWKDTFGRCFQRYTEYKARPIDRIDRIELAFFKAECDHCMTILQHIHTLMDRFLGRYEQSRITPDAVIKHLEDIHLHTIHFTQENDRKLEKYRERERCKFDSYLSSYHV